MTLLYGDYDYGVVFMMITTIMTMTTRMLMLTPYRPHTSPPLSFSYFPTSLDQTYLSLALTLCRLSLLPCPLLTIGVG